MKSFLKNAALAAFLFVAFVDAHAQVTVAPFLNAHQQFLDQNGNPVSGGCLWTYAAGTTTPQATYTTASGSTQNPDPIVLDSTGSATIFLTSAAYKFVLTQPFGGACVSGTSPIWTVDNITWSTQSEAFTSITDNGAFTMFQPAAATSSANQSSALFAIEGQEWNGSSSQVDEWCLQDLLGTGSNPASTLTFSHCLGSSGAASVSLGALSGATTTQQLNNVFYVGSGAGQYSCIESCVSALSPGGTCMVTPEWSETESSGNCSAVTMSTNFTTLQFLGGAYAQLSNGGWTISGGTIGISITSPLNQGGPNGNGPPATGGVVLDYRGSGDALSLGTSGQPAGGTEEAYVNGLDVVVSNAGSTAVGLHCYACGGHTRISNVFVGSSQSGSTTTGVFLDTGPHGDTSGIMLDNIDVAGTHTCVHLSNAEINSLYSVTCNGPSNESGSIGFFYDASVGGVAANHVFGTGGIGDYLNPIVCSGSHGCSDNYMVIETEATGGQPDVTFDSNASANEFILTGNISKSVSDSGSNNVVRRPGNTCVSGCPIAAIADTTLASAASNITFSSIPANYRHLRLLIQARSSNSTTLDNIQIQFNGDTSSDYDYQMLTANNSTASATPEVGKTVVEPCIVPAANATRANIAGTCTIDIPNYAGTTFEKSFVAESASIDSTAANNWATTIAGSWRSTAAITSIKLFVATGANLVAGTRATLYGVN